MNLIEGYHQRRRRIIAHHDGALTASMLYADASPDNQTTERFLIINRAYEVLTDPERHKIRLGSDVSRNG